MNLDDQLRWRARGESISVPTGFDERLEGLVQALPKRRGVRRSYLRVALVAAAACVALLTTAAAAYLMGAFNFLKDKEEY